ncbi:16S rRNA (uracil(1498)-N(3))-methyltransferase [Ascidiimonas sp. W6]|uniref:16S rRNA (uracil(1498)-N(3))-methyltransferase n=1 Tax=Ascidiimonas meishanensis TaxID=3128903 RepID=UPI0030EF5BEA
MQLFYHSNISENDQFFSFEKEESRHLSKVLRKNIGDEIHVTNGKGMIFKGLIEEISSKNCLVRITGEVKKFSRRYYLHMVVAPTKMNDRYEWFLEKATEIGVDEITPIFCERSERKSIKKERFEKVLISAMKQSLRSYLPKLNDPISLKEFLEKKHEGQLFIAHCEPGDKYHLKRRLQPDNPVTILIGPEGDFTPEEIERAAHRNFYPITLGKERLRTETAAIVACTATAFCNL